MTPDAFQAPTLEELAPLFPNYSIDAFIAQGGMGAVYLATQTSLERPVAIKILPREFGADEEFRKSFAAEAKAMAKLNHPNLIGVYDFGEVDGMPFIVMEYVAGKPLHDSAYGKQIDPAEASRIVMETCRGLHHAHEHDILHRDVKPANILLDPLHAVPKLGDFGLAMATTDESNDALIYGTPGYAAPEVYEGNPDARSDVYAAAVILYQLITGQMPDNPYQHPSALAQCDRRYDALLAKALQPDASSRHQTAEEFAEELEAIQKAPVAAAVASRPVISQRSATTSSQKSGAGPIIGAFAALLILGGGFFFLKSNKTEDSPGDSTDDIIVALPHKDSNASPTPLLVEKPIPPKVAPEPVEEREIVEVEVEEPEEPVEEETIAMVEKPDPIVTETPKIKEAPVSTFDHLGFLKRGRDYCIQKGANPLTEYHEDLLKNIARLEREGKSILRNEDYISNDDERARRNAIELTIKKYDEAGRLPENLVTIVPESFARLTYESAVVGKILREATAEQKNIEQELESNLQPLAEVYAGGIEKQAQTLSTEGNEYDANILLKEAKQARNNFPYFLKIVRGENPLPPALNNDPSHMSLEELLVGRWRAESSKTTFIFSADGAAKSRNPTQRGDWRIEGEQIIADWGTHKDLITIVPGEYNRFLANFRGNGRLVYFSRIDKDIPSDETSNTQEETPTETPVESNAPIVGNWLHQERTKKSIYTFQAGGEVLRDGGKASGKWKADGQDRYLVQWSTGILLKITMADNDTLNLNEGVAELTRIIDPIVGKWNLVSVPNSDVVFTFNRDHSVDNGTWNKKGTWAKVDGDYRITWNSGKLLTLEFQGTDAVTTTDSRGTRQRLSRQ